MNQYKKIGKLLRELREKNNKTLIEVANQIGVDKSALSFWERDINEPKASYLYELSKYYNVSADYLLGLSDDDLNYQNYDTLHNLSESEIKLIQKYRALSPEKKDKAYRIIDELNPQKLTTLEIAAYYGDEKTVSITEDAKRQILREMDPARKNRKKPPKK